MAIMSRYSSGTITKFSVILTLITHEPPAQERHVTCLASHYFTNAYNLLSQASLLLSF